MSKEDEDHRYIYLNIAMELCDGTIDDFVKGTKLFPGLTKKGIMIDTAKALTYLHSGNIVHKDIKPTNVLLSNKSCAAKLADFGIAKTVSANQTFTNPRSGTPLWTAPEIIDVTRKDERLKPGIDIFSLGLVYYYLHKGVALFGNDELNIVNGKHLSLTDTLPGDDSLQDLITAMIQNVAKDRISSSNILSHPYFWDDSKIMDYFREVKDTVADKTNSNGKELNDKAERDISNIIGGQSWIIKLPDELRDYFTKKNMSKRPYKDTFPELVMCIRNWARQSFLPDSYVNNCSSIYFTIFYFIKS